MLLDQGRKGRQEAAGYGSASLNNPWCMYAPLVCILTGGLRRLERLGLAGSNLGSVGNTEDGAWPALAQALHSNCAGIAELDLSKNVLGVYRRV
jgi:hypothetical protein